MLNSVGEKTPPCGTPVVRMCDFYIFVGFASLDVVCDELNDCDCAWNVGCCVVVDLPLLRVAVEGSDNPVSPEKPFQASLPPDQQGRHSLGRQPEVQYIA